MSTGQRFNYSPPLSLHAIYYAQENSVAREKKDKERKESTKVRKRKKEDEKKIHKCVFKLIVCMCVSSQRTLFFAAVCEKL